MLVADPLNVVLAMAVVEHGRALDRLHRGNLAAMQRLEAVAGAERSRRPAGTDEGAKTIVRMLLPEMTEDPVERTPGAMIVDEIVCKLGELIEDDVLPIARELSAFVVDLLDIAFGAGRADDVGWLCNPLLQPVETLAAHAGRKHGDTAAAEDAGNRDAAAAIIAGLRPDRTVMRRLEMPR